MSLIKLRDYQETARDKTIEQWESGNLDTMLVIPTGAGKTECALGVMAHERANNKSFRALFISHREELVTQPLERIKKGWYDRLSEPGVVMGRKKELDKEIVSATIQTLAPRKRKGDEYKRFHTLRKMLAHGAFTHVWIDEAHHAVSPSYTAVL